MAVIVILSLLTLTGLFFVYRVLALDNSNAEAPHSTKVSSKKFLDKKKAKQEFFANFFFIFQKKRELKVEPIQSLREYYAKKENDVPTEIDLTKQKISDGFSESGKSFIVRSEDFEKKTLKTSGDSFDELKKNYKELKSSYAQLEQLVKERTVRLEQTKIALDAELTLHQDFKKIKLWLEQQLADVRQELVEKDDLIERLQNSPVNRLSSQMYSDSEKQDESRDFVKLPEDLITRVKKADSHKDLRQSGKNKLFEALEDQGANLFYKMPSEEDVIRNLKSKKYSV